MNNQQVCILAIQRYENIKDIQEWIDYHLNLGFNQIYILDNNDESDPLILDTQNQQIVIIPYYGQRYNENDWMWQREAYNYGLDIIKKSNNQWVMVIDIDEFIELSLPGYTNINEFIQYECINKDKNNLELIWKLYNDDNKIYHLPEYDGNILNTYTYHFPVKNQFINSPSKFYSMRNFTKFIGKILPELSFTESVHYPSKYLLDNFTYKWDICDPNIAVIRHYKYKSLEDFISKKCLYRNYNTSVHGSAWKYSRTYFEDNDYNLNKILHFAYFDFHYKLGMENWDIEYLQELLRKEYRLCNDNKFIFDIWFGNKNFEDNPVIQKCLESRIKFAKDFKVININESNVWLDICPYTRFMYDHKLYGICADFFKCLLLYYFGGIYLDRDVELLRDINPYFQKNEYMVFDASFRNFNQYWFTWDHLISSSFMMAKPFNPIFKYFIGFCASLSKEKLNFMYNTMSKKDFMDYFYDIKIFHYQVCKKYGYEVKCEDNLEETIKSQDNIITVFNNYWLEEPKYKFNKYFKDKFKNTQQLLIHYNLKLHEQIYL